mgnify:CR=1 FL=1
MKWKEHLKRQLPSNGRWEIMNNCTGCACWHTLKAVTRRKESSRGIQASLWQIVWKQVHAVCRQQGGSKKICDADCSYIRKYEFELYKLGGCMEDSPE